MNTVIDIQTRTVDSADGLSAHPAEDRVVLRWLGQAGFQIRDDNCSLLIDPYLSDYLAKKYAGKEFAHRRMMAAPITAAQAAETDFLLCTHRHSDHMDPETVAGVLERNRRCRLVAPEAEKDHVLGTLGIPQRQALFVDAGQTVQLAGGITLEAVASAHEDLKQDEHGRYCYLGYIVRVGDVSLYHSGDCMPYEGLAETLRAKTIDMALLPVNGRDAYRRSRQVPGNFTFDEAVALCCAAGIGTLICHHFGMFAFNTVDPQTFAESVRRESAQGKLRIIVPGVGMVYRCKKGGKGG